MDRQGHDANITSQGFGSIIYGPQSTSNQSALTVHGQSTQNVDSAIIGLPRHPNTAFIVDLTHTRMCTLNSWTLLNMTNELQIPNFYANTLAHANVDIASSGTTATTTPTTITAAATVTTSTSGATTTSTATGMTPSTTQTTTQPLSVITTTTTSGATAGGATGSDTENRYNNLNLF